MQHWALEWVGYYLIGKVVLGVLAGIVVGRLLAYVAFRSRARPCAWPSGASRCWRSPRWCRRTASAR